MKDVIQWIGIIGYPMKNFTCDNKALCALVKNRHLWAQIGLVHTGEVFHRIFIHLHPSNAKISMEFLSQTAELLHRIIYLHFF